jgi:hypothetical protein
MTKKWFDSELITWALQKAGFKTGATSNSIKPQEAINRVNASLAKQLERSIARNSRMVSRLQQLLKLKPTVLGTPPDYETRIRKIINDQDPE